VGTKHERVHRLWDELSEFGAWEWEKALVHMLRRLVELIPASNAGWVAVMRVDPDAPTGDPLYGWRPQTMKLLRAEPGLKLGTRHEGAQIDHCASDWTAIAAMRDAGSHRVLRLGGGLCPAARRRDALYTFIPMDGSTEAVISLFRDSDFRRFSSSDEALAEYALRSLKWFQWRVLLGHGLMFASAPLTRTERRVLQALLEGEAEKVVASRLRMSYSSTHDHVANIYKKFGINSRAELMALWLGKRVEASASGSRASTRRLPSHFATDT
jgi:DNA-binding CsgD family transcriptional regulator